MSPAPPGFCYRQSAERSDTRDPRHPADMGRIGVLLVGRSRTPAPTRNTWQGMSSSRSLRPRRSRRGLHEPAAVAHPTPTHSLPYGPGYPSAARLLPTAAGAESLRRLTHLLGGDLSVFGLVLGDELVQRGQPARHRLPGPGPVRRPGLLRRRARAGARAAECRDDTCLVCLGDRRVLLLAVRSPGGETQVPVPARRSA
jgi:hypothetical protein